MATFQPFYVSLWILFFFNLHAINSSLQAGTLLQNTTSGFFIVIIQLFGLADSGPQPSLQAVIQLFGCKSKILAELF